MSLDNLTVSESREELKKQNKINLIKVYQRSQLKELPMAQLEQCEQQKKMK